MYNQDNQREDIRLAYIAGIIDGEGTIAIRKHHKEKKYQPYVSIVNTNYEVVKMVADFIGAKRIFIHDPSTNGYQGRLICYKAMVIGRFKTKPTIEKLLPYLIIKREAAKICLKLANEMKASRVGKLSGKNYRTTPIEETQWREEIYQKYLDIVHPQRLNRMTPKGEVIV